MEKDVQLLEYFGEHYDRLKKVIENATKGNYSDDFYHHIILKLKDKKGLINIDNYIFIFANREYFMKRSEWNLTNRPFEEIEDQQELSDEELTTNQQQLNRYLHTYDNLNDEVNKKIMLLYLSCKNENDLYKQHGITPKTLKNAIEYVRLNFQIHSSSYDNDCD